MSMTTTTILEKDLEQTPVDVSRLSEKEKQELMAADAVSITSETTLGQSDLSFHPIKSLYINTKGIAMLRLPVPPSELQISIHNNDGSVAYQSTRKTRRSGNCILTDAEDRELIATEYFFGPNRDPVLHLLEAGNIEFKTATTWTSRSHTFNLPDGRTFTWDYKKERGFGAAGKKGTALVLSVDGVRVAALIRNEETRTPGSKSCSAGNGGELVLGEQVNGKDGISEELVVASCMLMLKKEIDRRRTVQFMMIGAAASGGS